MHRIGTTAPGDGHIDSSRRVAHARTPYTIAGDPTGNGVTPLCRGSIHSFSEESTCPGCQVGIQVGVRFRIVLLLYGLVIFSDRDGGQNLVYNALAVVSAYVGKNTAASAPQ